MYLLFLHLCTLRHIFFCLQPNLQPFFWEPDDKLKSIKVSVPVVCVNLTEQRRLRQLMKHLMETDMRQNEVKHARVSVRAVTSAAGRPAGRLPARLRKYFSHPRFIRVATREIQSWFHSIKNIYERNVDCLMNNLIVLEKQ